MNEKLLHLEAVAKEFQTGDKILAILHDLSVSIDSKETLAIQGPSGSGKSTLLGLMAGLERPSSGRILYKGAPLHTWSEDQLSQWRRTDVGFIFQNFRLIDSLTAHENVRLPLEILGVDLSRAEEEASQALVELGIDKRAGHFPHQLSGGEQQRVAIARAYAHRPAIIFADEPTGSLDRETAQSVLDSLLRVNAEKHTALVLVTHDPAVAARMDRTLSLNHGALA